MSFLERDLAPDAELKVHEVSDQTGLETQSMFGDAQGDAVVAIVQAAAAANRQAGMTVDPKMVQAALAHWVEDDGGGLVNAGHSVDDHDPASTHTSFHEASIADNFVPDGAGPTHGAAAGGAPGRGGFGGGGGSGGGAGGTPPDDPFGPSDPKDPKPSPYTDF